MARLSDISGTHAATLANSSCKDRATLAKLSTFNDLDLARVPRTSRPVTAKIATPAKRIGTDARTAVLAFLRHMDEEVGTTALAFSVWRASYDDLRLDEGWPPLSDKVFSLALQQCGCVVSTIDDRKRGRGRYRAYEFRGTP